MYVMFTYLMDVYVQIANFILINDSRYRVKKFHQRLRLPFELVA